MAADGVRRIGKRLQLRLWHRRAAVSGEDRREERRLREQAQRAGREQTLAQLGTPPDWLRLSDEHISVSGARLRLTDMDSIEVLRGQPATVRITSGSARWAVELHDVSSLDAAQFAQAARDAKAVVHDVRAIYEQRRTAALSELSAILAERHADRERCAARARELEHEIALKRQSTTY